MASVIISGDTSGSVTLAAPATAGSTVLTLPVGTATLTANGLNSNIVAGTSVTASGTSVGFTNIPSWVKRITVMFQSLVSPANPSIVLGTSGGLVTTGYLGATCNENSSNNSVGNISTGFLLNTGTLHGAIVFTNITGNNWVGSGNFGISSSALIGYISGSIALGGTLTQLAFTSGTAFTSGNINILYE
jgi:hypothetical protein